MNRVTANHFWIAIVLSALAHIWVLAIFPGNPRTSEQPLIQAALRISLQGTGSEQADASIAKQEPLSQSRQEPRQEPRQQPLKDRPPAAKLSSNNSDLVSIIEVESSLALTSTDVAPVVSMQPSVALETSLAQEDIPIEVSMHDPDAVPIMSNRNQAETNPLTSVENEPSLSKPTGQESEASALLALLYSAINNQKHYPYTAIRQRREGLVNLTFTIHPDGLVTDIEIIKSSRFRALDKAAIHAVASISPFALAADYLEETHHYNVDIDFRLN